MEASAVPFDKFEVVRKLGRGGMGTVYEGYDPALERRVAIKTLTTDAISDEESRRRFEREARAAAKLQHPNIVTIYELGNFGSKDKPYIVMEYLDGTDLTSLVKGDERLCLDEALEISAQLCRALDFAHQHDVVHRDVKPSNIRVLDDGRVKIMDFGIARIEGGDQITRSGVMVGTPHYMSPEQVKGGKIDGRSDVFSAGCILYEMLAGKRPFQGESATSILYKIVNEEPPPILEEDSELPQEIENLLQRALAKDPGKRFCSAGEMAEELEKLLRVYHMSFPRLPLELQKRLDHLERLDRDKKWAEALPLARQLLGERPELAPVRRILRKAERMLYVERKQNKATPEEKTRHLAEISEELTHLYGPAQLPTVADARSAGAEPTAGELKLRTRTATGAGEPSLPVSRKVLIAAVASIAVAVAAWVLVPRVMGPGLVTHSLRISSHPPGCSIAVNGKLQGVVTKAGGPVEVVLQAKQGESVSIELSRSGYTPIRRSITLGTESPPPLELSLEPLPVELEVRTQPSGAALKLDGVELAQPSPTKIEITPGEEHELLILKDGFTTKTLKLTPGGKLPTEEIVLVPLAKPGTLAVSSPYPLSLSASGGATLARASTSPSVKLRPGRHEITLYAPEVFLNRSFSVDIREAETTSLEAPLLGKISIQAVPGNCKVLIDGIEAEAPPILNKDIVEGAHTIVFQWPSGQRQEKTQAVRRGRHAYVTGRIR